MEQIIIADKNRYATAIHDLFSEYLSWGASRVNQDFGLGFSAENTIEQDMLTLDKFMPPKGRLLLALVEDTPIGVAGLKELDEKTGEVKRMYVKPEFRGRGLGKALLQKLFDEANVIGYSFLRLDSARFMTDAHRLYHSMGFIDIGHYEGSEIPAEYQSYWVFMEKPIK